MGASAKSGLDRRQILKGGALLLSLPALAVPARAAQVPASKVLRLRNLHTEELLDVVYWRGIYIRDGLDAINKLMRDYRTGEIFPMDRRLLDQLYDLSQRLNMTSDHRFEIISGFRSPKTQAMLATLGDKTQGNITYHMAGRAIDLRVPKIPLEKVYRTALAMKAGGVGYYPRPLDNFVHLDRGSFRTWTNNTEEPQGKAENDS